jgi:hypothetical protein
MKACYHGLYPYKYITTRQFECETGITGYDVVGLDDEKKKKIELKADGKLIISERYSWDGPSGPAPDLKCLMRGSMVHDALYQLIRKGKIDPWEKYKADRLLREMCITDKAWPILAWVVYLAVYMFSGSAAIPGEGKVDMEKCSP